MPSDNKTRRVTIASVSATTGGSSDKGDDAKSIKLMIFETSNNWLEIYCRHIDFRSMHVEHSDREANTPPNPTVALHSYTNNRLWQCCPYSNATPASGFDMPVHFGG
ncbi:hypothetical protein GCM10026988_35200 [Vibrio panuliri]